ncbi:urease accessory protein UreD [Rhodobacter sp.]
MPDGGHRSADAGNTRRGRLDLGFAPDPAGRTFLSRQFSSYPFHIGRAFHLDSGPAGGMATLYIQSCSGGLYTQDDLSVSVDVSDGAQAHLTTQASTIVHRATRGPARQSVRIRAGEGALMEYLPDATILFPGASFESSLRLEVAPTASAILFDSFLAHRFDGDPEVFDRFANTVEICCPDGRPLAIDRFCVTGRSFCDGTLGRMGGFACHGSVMAVAPSVDRAGWMARMRQAVLDIEGAATGISELPGGIGISARILAREAIAMRKAMHRLWEISRSMMTGAAPAKRSK